MKLQSGSHFLAHHIETEGKNHFRQLGVEANVKSNKADWPNLVAVIDHHLIQLAIILVKCKSMIEKDDYHKAPVLNFWVLQHGMGQTPNKTQLFWFGLSYI